MPVLFSNNASTTLSAGINNSQTTIAIASASGFPSLGSGEYYYGTIANTNNTKVEVVKVTAGTTSLTVTRAQDGTSAQAFDSGDNFQLRVTAATLDATSKSDVAITAGSVQADTLIAKGDGSSADGQIQLNCSQNSHGIKLKSPPHSAGASYTLTFPNDDGSNGQKLTTNGSGVLTWTDDTDTTYSVGDGGLTTNDFTNDDHSKLNGIEASATADQTDAEIRAAVEAATDSNVFTDADHTKLNGIAASANAYVHPNHSGEVTSTADGATVIADNVVDEANLKVSNTPTNGYFLSAQSGNTGGLTWAEVDTTIANDSIDSQHYAAGSIDHEHLAADCVDGDNIQDDVINSEHIAAGAIDLEHLSSESVDEDNLYVSNAGTNGQFLSKQSGNNGGLTWADAGGAIPSGTVMAFFQANAPTGWTKVTSQNDKMLRVVSGTGGGTGGSAAVTSPAHNLSAGAHTLSTAELASHSHGGVITGGGSVGNYPGNGGGWRNWIVSLSSGSTSSAGSGSSHSHSMSGSITTPQYIDVIICSYD
jgi:hypothetical protein